MAEKFKQFWTLFLSQSKVFFGGLSFGRKIVLIVSVFAVLFGLLGVYLWYSDTTYEVAYTNLTEEDRLAILSVLKTQNISDFKMTGDSLLFPTSFILDYKMRLAQEGLPSVGRGTGWEKFDEKAFGLTDFDQKIKQQVAIQGELQRTINRIAVIDSSRVHIVMPERSVFARSSQNHATASIQLKLKYGKQLTQKQVLGIQHLVANAVPSLSIEYITISDQEGNLLSAPPEEAGSVREVTDAQRQYQKNMEQDLTEKIRRILARVVGSEKISATVRVDVDFTQVERTIHDVDPDRIAVLSSNRTEQSTTGSGINPTGVPGVKSNLPGDREDVSTAGSRTESKQNSELLNYDVKKTVSKVVEPVANIRNISAAVLVDYKYVNGVATARTPEEMERIASLVKSAIGFKEGRDSITVESTLFEADEFEVAQMAALDARKTSLLQTAIIGGVSILAMIFLFFAVVKPYFHWLTFDPNKESKEKFAVMDYELERSNTGARRVQIQEEIPFDKLSPKEQILYLAAHDPQKTTEAIRQMLSPHQN